MKHPKASPMEIQCAKGVYEQFVRECREQGIDVKPWSAIGKFAQEAGIAQAQRHIRAMRDLTPDMLKLFHDAGWHGNISGDHPLEEEQGLRLWQKLVDHASPLPKKPDERKRDRRTGPYVFDPNGKRCGGHKDPRRTNCGRDARAQ